MEEGRREREGGSLPLSNLKCQLYEVLSLQCCVGAGHGDDLGLLGQQIVDPVSACPQQLKGPELLTTRVQGGEGK